jgi:hypothetical protein
MICVSGGCEYQLVFAQRWAFTPCCMVDHAQRTCLQRLQLFPAYFGA